MKHGALVTKVLVSPLGKFTDAGKFLWLNHRQKSRKMTILLTWKKQIFDGAIQKPSDACEKATLELPRASVERTENQGAAHPISDLFTHHIGVTAMVAVE